MSTSLRFTVRDLELLPDDTNRYEIIDGELYVSRAPHWRHQIVSDKTSRQVGTWSDETGLGVLLPTAGLVFAEDQAVIPDLVWISRDRFRRVIGRDGKLHRAPDLVIEILSPGPENEERDREVKLKLYSRQGVREYWILDPTDQTIAIYRRVELALQLVATLTTADTLISPLLRGFSCPVQALFPPELQLEPEESAESSD